MEVLKMFKIGDVIKRTNKEKYSHSNIYSGSFVVVGIDNNKYMLSQSNFIGDMDINSVNNSFTIDEKPKGFIVNIQNHILSKQTNVSSL
jgi:hypothetical protein